MKLFQSNQMIELARVFCERNRQVEDPFTPTTVVVPSIALGSWLKLQLADAHGIAANVDCVLPATYLWRLYRHLIPETANLEHSPFDRDRLTWRIMRTLNARQDLSTAVNQYLDGVGDRDLRLLQLADQLATLFDAYLMYRPRWMLDWQFDRDTTSPYNNGDWQAGLWRALLAEMEGQSHLHRAALHQKLLQQIAGQHPLPDSQLSAFGFSTLPPLQLETFEQLSTRIDVDVYFMNPCEHYWGDIVSPKDLARRSIRNMIGKQSPLEDEDYLEVGNPLLASLGKQGREMFEQMIESPRVESYELFTENPGNRALDFVKNDILNLTFGGEYATGAQPNKRPLDDNSLQIHSCHSAMREVEILKDAVLRAFKSSPDLRPADIIVMVPDIARYAPYIHAVFTGDIPYRITDQSMLDDSPLTNSFLTLLNLPQSRLTATEVMDLLEIPAVMRRFDLNPADIDVITFWIDAVSIRWEVDGTSKADRWDLPAENQNSWRFGLDRLLLGFAMNEQIGSWAGTLPFEITSADAERLGKLGYFIDQIDSYRRQLDARHTAPDWFNLLSSLLSDFFEPTNDESQIISQLLKTIDSVTSHAVTSEYLEPLSRESMAHAIKQTLTEDNSSATIVSGSMTFANLVPMRSIPFRVVCLLGMNDGDYPRDKRPHSFDLIAQSPHQPGDRSRKLDDRYLFLEALLSARDLFYVSYVGRGVRDNQPKPPSVVVSEWLAYLEDCFETAPLTEHALQPFNPRYYQGGALQSFESRWYSALEQLEAPVPFNDRLLPMDDTLAEPGLEMLANFYRHPAKFFLQQRLGVYLDTDEQAFKDSEAFELNQLERYQIAEQALVELINQRSLAQFRDHMLLTGALLSGQIGEQHLDREIIRATNIYQPIEALTRVTAEALRSELRVGNVRLPVVITNLFDDKLVRFRVGALGAKEKIQAWVMHLAANMIRPGINTVIVSRGKQDAAETTWFAPVDAERSAAHLHTLIELYFRGCTEPLFLPPAASEQFVKDVNQGKTDSTAAALQQARRKWSASQQSGAEQLDRYWQRLFPETGPTATGFDEDFASHSHEIWQPIFEAIDAGEGAP